jgi:hypothetical protein
MRLDVPPTKGRDMKRLLVIPAAALAALAITPVQGAAAPPPGFDLSPTSLSFTAAVDSFQYQFVTVTTSRRLVIQNPATLSGDVSRTDGGSIFFDTQAGSCWQQYEALGDPLPAHTTCTIQVGFHPDAVRSYNATLTVSRCTHWHLDPTFGFIVCDALDGSKTASLTGTGT